MRRVVFGFVFVVFLASTTAIVSADVRSDQRVRFQLGGAIGKLVNMFGGKGAREGVTSTVAVKGNRKATLSDSTGQIIDLSEEKIYEVDYKKKEYKVTTFEELRQRMREAKERAEKDAAREEQREEKPEKEKQQPAKEYEMDFNAKETGQTKQIAGYDTRQVIMTVTVREKGKPIDESGGMVVTSDTWLGPEIASLEELRTFDRKYYEKLYGAESIALAAEQMAMVMAMYPQLQSASARLAKEGDKLKGTALHTTTVFEAVKSKAQMTEQANQSGSSGGGLGGMLARRIKKEDPKQRATVLTLTTEYQEVGTNVTGTDVELPAGFKEKK